MSIKTLTGAPLTYFKQQLTEITHAPQQRFKDLTNTYLDSTYFQRSFNLEKPESLKKGLRFIETLLPLASLYSPVSKPLSYAVTGFNGLTALVKGQWHSAIRNTVELAATFFEMRAALFLHASLNIFETTKDLLCNFQTMALGEGCEKILKVAGDALYLATLIKFTKKSFCQITLISLGVQTLYHSLQFGRQVSIYNTIDKKELNQYRERCIRQFDILSKFVMIVARLYQADNERIRIQNLDIISSPAVNEASSTSVSEHRITEKQEEPSSYRWKEYVPEE